MEFIHADIPFYVSFVSFFKFMWPVLCTEAVEVFRIII